MSRDGLLPPVFSKMHPVYKTPAFSTIVTGLLVGVPALILDADFVTDLCSIGTLFAFVLVCGGILVLPQKDAEKGKFKLPYFNGKLIVPCLAAIVVILIQYFLPHVWMDFFFLKSTGHPEMAWQMVLRERAPFYILFIVCLLLTVNTYRKNYSLIPILGLLSCLYLMTELGARNWERFIIWLLLGLIVYFAYSRKRSKLNK
jgi:APA family basic amino acid/polyamine antiporter